MADVSKLVGYAVTGASETSAIASKVIAYAVTGAPETFACMTKVVAYLVTEDVTLNARPHVAVIT
mgnify:CR=1 FL=1